MSDRETEMEAVRAAFNAMAGTASDVGHAIDDGHVEPEAHGELQYCVTELLAACRALDAAFGLSPNRCGELHLMQWQSIETAPRDGSLILAYRPLADETGDPIIAVVKTTSHPRTSKQGVEHYTDRYCHPTHWMPLPPAPRQKEDA